ncbi:Hypothetical protein GLP15_3572 [Giardia lamblia P15]|uniref:Transmembrane protein n=1 Tax=Giardia intestinalis (strain P15) TaxID=658858 RepID=E1F7H1_GIAIA|nr:Hypothetical protein GLP15_3572 [Giardia lamblia P15]
MTFSRVEKLSRCACASLVAGALLLGLGAIAGTIAISFYHGFFYSVSPDLCPRNVIQFNEYLCAGEDFRSHPTPTKPFSVIFGPFSPFSREINFRMKLNLTESMEPISLNMTYFIYKTRTLGAVSRGTSNDDSSSPSPPSPTPPRDLHGHEWMGWSYAQDSSDSWELLEKRTFSVKKLKNHGPKSKLPCVPFYKKDGIDENYYKLEVSTLSFSNPSTVSSIFFEVAPGPKESGILSVVLICVGMTIGVAVFIHICWMLRLSWAGRFSELPFFSRLSIWMSLCALFSFTPLSLLQYFDDTFEYIIANSALEQLSIVGSLILLLMACRHLLVSIPNEFAQLVKLVSFFRGKIPVIVIPIFAAIGSASIALCHIDPALGKSYTVSSYVFAAFAAVTYIVSLIMMFLVVDCMRRAKVYIDAKRAYYLTFFCVIWETLILLASIVYVIWHPGRLRAYDMLHFNHLMVCALFAELMCPISGSRKVKKKDDIFNSFNGEHSLYDDIMANSRDYSNDQH